MGKFTAIPKDTFEALQLDAGVLLKTFDPANPDIAEDAQITATTGGITIAAVPTFSDLFEDVDNAPNGVKEGKHLDSWDVSISTTGLGTSPELIRLSLGCADIDANNTAKIVPRRDVLQTDFQDIWWVGDRADGGCVAVKLKNGLSTAGFSLQTTKNGKGQTALTITGHVSINKQDEMPIEFYSIAPPEGDVWNITQTLTNVTSSSNATTVVKGGTFSATLTADEGYSLTEDGASVTVTVGGDDVTSTAYSNGAVSVVNVSGDIVITATAVVDAGA